MKKLTKQHIADRDQICAKLRDTREKLETSVTEFNDKRSAAWEALQDAVATYNDVLTNEYEDVNEALADYNEAREEAVQWTGDVAAAIDEYMSGRSEKWLEGERGQVYSEWKSVFEDESLEEPEIEQPEGVDIEEPNELSVDGMEDAAEKIEGLQELT